MCYTRFSNSRADRTSWLFSSMATNLCSVMMSKNSCGTFWFMHLHLALGAPLLLFLLSCLCSGTGSNFLFLFFWKKKESCESVWIHVEWWMVNSFNSAWTGPSTISSSAWTSSSSNLETRVYYFWKKRGRVLQKNPHNNTFLTSWLDRTFWYLCQEWIGSSPLDGFFWLWNKCYYIVLIIFGKKNKLIDYILPALGVPIYSTCVRNVI